MGGFGESVWDVLYSSSVYENTDVKRKNEYVY